MCNKKAQLTQRYARDSSACMKAPSDYVSFARYFRR